MSPFFDNRHAVTPAASSGIPRGPGIPHRTRSMTHSAGNTISRLSLLRQIAGPVSYLFQSLGTSEPLDQAELIFHSSRNSRAQRVGLDDRPESVSGGLPCDKARVSKKQNPLHIAKMSADLAPTFLKSDR